MLDGGKFRRFGEAGRFFGGDEFLDGGAEVFEICGNFLDAGFRGARARAYAGGGGVFEPGGIDVACTINEVCGNFFRARGFGEAGGIGRILRADNEDDIGELRDFGDGVLAVGGCVANILAGRGDDVGVLLCECLNDVGGFGDAQCCLGEIGEFFVCIEGECFDVGFGLDEWDGLSIGMHCFADNTDSLGVPFVSNVDDRVAVFHEAVHFEVHFVYEGAGGVDNGAVFLSCSFEILRRGTVCGEDDDGVFRNRFGVVDGDGAAILQIFHNSFVVNDLVFDIDRRTEDIECVFNGLYGARHTRAKPARRSENDFCDHRFSSSSLKLPIPSSKRSLSF